MRLCACALAALLLGSGAAATRGEGAPPATEGVPGGAPGAASGRPADAGAHGGLAGPGGASRSAGGDGRADGGAQDAVDGGPLGTGAPPAASEAALGTLVEEVVLVVGDAVVTRSDLELEARVVLVGNGGLEAAFGPIDVETVRSVQSWLVSQLLIHAEAERLGVFEASPEEVEQALDAFRRRFGDEATWRRFLRSQDVGEDRIAAILRRNIRVRRYLESRVKLTVQVSDEDVAAFYERERSRFGDRSLDAVREVIRGYLFKQRYEASVRKLVRDLSSWADPRVLAEPRAFPGRELPIAPGGP